MLRRTRPTTQAFFGFCVALASVTLLGGCGEGSSSAPVVEVDQAKLKAEQDQMRANMEKAHERPKGGPRGR